MASSVTIFPGKVSSASGGASQDPGQGGERAGPMLQFPKVAGSGAHPGLEALTQRWHPVLLARACPGSPAAAISL